MSLSKRRDERIGTMRKQGEDMQTNRPNPSGTPPHPPALPRLTEPSTGRRRRLLPVRSYTREAQPPSRIQRHRGDQSEYAATRESDGIAEFGRDGEGEGEERWRGDGLERGPCEGGCLPNK
ncbi:hypothetical protein B296_00014949 [Ensete ventricosum]|uniref:Uncharacterized protein n=1 Tax=Ensete ventricosum TaxID=4639 RepID=A0A427AWK5_ENSVE|nr:hypothetical protein B296_00014949 [Ensete ventricosum]